MYRALIVPLFLLVALLLPSVAQAEMSLLDKTLKAHGGLDAFRAFGGMEYTLVDFPLSAKSPERLAALVDLKRRAYLIEGEGYSLGYTPEAAWGAPTIEATGMSPSLIGPGHLYLFLQPFLFGVDGGMVKELGAKDYAGVAYDTFEVRYAAGTGDTPDDTYVVYVDRETGLVKLFHFSVHHPGVKGDAATAPRKAMIFEVMQNVQGLSIPKGVRIHAWDTAKGVTTDEGASFLIREVRLLKDRPAASRFAMPSGAEVDTTFAK